MLILIALILLAGFPSGAHAYVDPGTTSSVFGLVAAVVSGVGVVGAFLVRPITRFFRRRKPDGVASPATDVRPPTDDTTPPSPPAA